MLEHWDAGIPGESGDTENAGILGESGPVVLGPLAV